LAIVDPSTDPVHVADDLARPTRARYQALALLSTAAAIAYVLRGSMAVASEPIQKDFYLSPTKVGWLMSMFFIGYSLLQVPSGWLADRWGARKTLAVCAVAWSIAGAMMAVAPDYACLLPLWFLAGAAQAGAFPCATSVIRHWMPGTRRALGTGILGSSMAIGLAISPPLTSMLLAWTDWRWVFVALSLPGIAWAAFFYDWFRDRPGAHPGVNRAELDIIHDGLPTADMDAGLASRAPPTPWLGLLTSRAMWAICSQHFFRAAAFIFFATWFPTFLKESRGITMEHASLLTVPPLVAMALANPLGGYLSDLLLVRTGSRRVARQYFAAANLLICAAFVAGAFFVDGAGPAVMIITAGSFFAALGGVSAYAITIDMGGEHVGTVFSLMNMCGNIGASVCPVCIAWIVERTGHWDPVLFIFAAIYVAAAVSWLLLNPNGTVLDSAALENN
jgi:sugar phosphate permease